MAEIHIDPKTEIENKVKGILKLIKDGDLNMDGTPEEILKREPLAELVRKIKNIINELNVLEKEVESPQHQNSELDVIEDKFNLAVAKKLEEIEELEEIHTDPKTEIEDKVKVILKLIQDGDLDMDGTPEEILKREPLAELVKISEEKLKLVLSTIMSKHSEAKRILTTFFIGQCHNKIQAPVDCLTRQKREVEEQLRAKESELNTLKQKASDYEKQASEYQKQISANRNEISKLAQENLEKDDDLDKMNKELTSRKAECSALNRKLNKGEKGDASGKISALTAKVDDLQKDLLSLQKTKEELELNCEKLRKERAQTLTIVDNEKNELVNIINDLQKTLKKWEDAYQKLNEDYKKVGSKFNECKVNLEVANRKIEEKEKELREGIGSKDQIITDLEHQVEDLKRDLKEKGNETRTLLENVKKNHEEELCLSNQKLRDTEQLLSDKEESSRKAEKEFQQVRRELEDRNATLVARITAANNKAFHETITDTLSKKFSDDCNNYQIENSIANISHELQNVKEYVSEMNRENEKLQNDKKLLLEELQGKKEEELTLLREKVEKLEAKAKAKEEGTGQEQMEAIRQISLKIDNLAEIVSKPRSHC